MYIVIAYDIEDDRQRNKLAQTLLDEGIQRVQKSVFEGEIDNVSLQKLKQKLKKRIKDHDSIRYYILCNECRLKTAVQGLDLTPVSPKQVIVQ